MAIPNYGYFHLNVSLEFATSCRMGSNCPSMSIFCQCASMVSLVSWNAGI